MKYKREEDSDPQKYEDINTKCPECGEEYDFPYKGLRCICRDPLFIVIAPGQHIHIHCPVHGDVKIYGPRMHWLSSSHDPRCARVCG